MKNFVHEPNIAPASDSLRRRLFLLPLIMLFFSGGLWAQPCPGDTEAPTIACLNGISVNLLPTGEMTLFASEFLQFASDNCTQYDNLILQIKRNSDGPCDADSQADDFGESVTFCCADVGQTIEVTLRVSDSNGNFSECGALVEINDLLAPICIAPANVTVTCDSFDPSLEAYGQATGQDNCAPPTLSGTVDYGLFDTLCHKGTISRHFTAADANGNTSHCTQRIVVNYNQNYSVRFPDDLWETNFNPNGNYGEPQILGEGCELIGLAYTDLIITIVPNADYKIERTWTVINWCTYEPDEGLIYIPNPQPDVNPTTAGNLTGPTVSPAGTPGFWAPTSTPLVPGGPVTDFSTFWSANVNGYEYKQIIHISDTVPGTIMGRVFEDANQNCSYDPGETLMANWPVRVTSLPSGAAYTTITDSLGQYFQIVSTYEPEVEITLAAPGNFGQNCATTFVRPFSGNFVGQDIPVHLEASCPILSVDLAVPILRRCFNNNMYVSYANLSAQTVEDAHVEVQLDAFQNYQSSSIPGSDLGGNRYSFELGDLAAGQSGSFSLTINLDCDAEFGATHCAEAFIFPDTICGENGAWAGSNIEIEALCDGDSVRFTLKNTGAGPTTAPLEYIVAEDVIMYRQADYQLAPGESMPIEGLPANGYTWRVETAQESGHPFGGTVARAIEGCGGLNSPGLVTAMPVGSSNPFHSTECVQNRGSFDPNDKQGLPTGVGPQHLIRENTDIEYMIRFQNTGTDTAFQVVILDTLSAFLNPASIRTGAASHDFDFSLLDGNVARFTFDNILLPDSNVNEPASHGFIQFRIKQVADNPLGTRIENRAAIYFDFNAPVITNTTLHTIGDDFLISVTQDDLTGEKLAVYPNPSAGTVFFELPEAGQGGRFSLRDNLGKTLMTQDFAGHVFRFEKGNLPAGTYFFNVTTAAGRTYSGKVMLRF